MSILSHTFSIPDLLLQRLEVYLLNNLLVELCQLMNQPTPAPLPPITSRQLWLSYISYISMNTDMWTGCSSGHVDKKRVTLLYKKIMSYMVYILYIYECGRGGGRAVRDGRLDGGSGGGEGACSGN